MQTMKYTIPSIICKHTNSYLKDILTEKIYNYKTSQRKQEKFCDSGLYKYFKDTKAHIRKEKKTIIWISS